MGGATDRCVVHPARPAADACPVCGRCRCAADARSAPGGGCLACRGASAQSAPAVPPLEAGVRAALAGLGVALPGGVVAAQYVDAGLFAYLTPAIVGVLCGAAAQAAAGVARRGPLALGVRALACLCAVLGVGLGYVLEGSRSALEVDNLGPYAAAVVGTVLWTLPPKAKGPRTPRRPPLEEGRPSRRAG